MSASSASTSRLPWPSAAYDVLVIGDLNRTQRQVTTMAIRGQHGFSGAEFFAGARGLCEGAPRGLSKWSPPWARPEKTQRQVANVENPHRLPAVDSEDQ